MIENRNLKRTQGNGVNQQTVIEDVPFKLHEFKVKREILFNAAEYFKALLEGGFKESNELVINIQEERPICLEVWLKILHGSDLKSTYRNVDLRGMWEVLAASHKYCLSPKDDTAKKWFEG